MRTKTEPCVGFWAEESGEIPDTVEIDFVQGVYGPDQCHTYIYATPEEAVKFAISLLVKAESVRKRAQG